MVKPTKLIGSLTNEILCDVISTCANLPEVRREVFKNHDNNLWWPTTTKDWRLRMVIAGWSTRVSYNMISTYQRVVSDAINIGYESLCRMSDEDLENIVGPLGLFTARRDYLKSLKQFVDELKDQAVSPFEISNDDLIDMFARRVRGANYKVAQCAVLYAKGYHCGIFPVDSGMKDMLGPCLGLHLPRGPVAHEIMRKHIETILNTNSTDYYNLALRTGYGELSIAENIAPIWWAHLVLIYFKRLYCNKKNPIQCPLRSDSNIGECVGAMCDRNVPRIGGYPYVVLEGIDCVGKTTVAEKLKAMGYKVYHSMHNPDYINIVSHYQTLINESTAPAVFDRSFISEVTYGRAIRKQSRLSESDLRSLLELLSKKHCIIFYLKEDKEIVRNRLLDSQNNHRDIIVHLDNLISEYDECMKIVSDYMPVYEIHPTTVPQDHLISHILEIMNR